MQSAPSPGSPRQWPSAAPLGRLGRGLLALSKRQLVIAVGAGLLVRVLIHAVVLTHAERGDAAGYDALARGIVEHGVFGDTRLAPLVPSVFRAPLYPAFLAMIFATSGHHYAVVWVLQSLLNLAAAVILAATIATRFPKLGVGVLWVMCLSPFEAVYTGALLSETLGSALLVFAFCAPFLWRGWRGALLCGALLGLTALTREVYMLIAFPAAALLGWRDRSLATAALVLAGCIALIGPWSVRNTIVTGRLIPISQGRLGLALWIGTWADNADFTSGDAEGSARAYPETAWLDAQDRQRVTDAEHRPDADALDRVYRDSFRRHLQTRPLQVVYHWLRRTPLMWFSTRFDIFELRPALFPRRSAQWKALKAGLFALDAAMVLSALLGLVRSARWNFLWCWWALPILYTFAIYVPVNSFESRYSQPALPFVVLFSVGGVLLIGRWLLRARGASTPSVSSSGLRS